MKQEFIEEQRIPWGEHRSRDFALCETFCRRRTHGPVEHSAIPRRLAHEIESARDELEAPRVGLATTVGKR